MASKTESGDNWWGNGVEMTDAVDIHARFQVNRVDTGTEEMERLCEDDDDALGSYAKSFRHCTREALPRMDNYRNITSIQAAYRPTLDELHNVTVHHKVGYSCVI